MSIAELKKFTFTSKYAGYLEDKKRRETWAEAVDRLCDMFLMKYTGCGIETYIEEVRRAIKKKEILGSQRALQFAGKPIFKHNARLYNCISSYCDRPRFFQECMYLLLCGCGTGFSVQKHHVAKLPKLIESKEGTKKYTISDSIEGWSEAIGIIVNSYFRGGIYPEYEGKTVTFDYTKIRPRGASLSSSVGTAPGPEPLKNAVNKIRKLLDRCLEHGQQALRPIDCYDIIMHAADAVISGGVRRSATICVFSPDDKEMANAKVGNWLDDNPQRGRSNNSALLLRSATSKKDFDSLMQNVKEYGEPGFVWADSPEFLVNPCVTADTLVTTSDGLFLVNDLHKGFNPLVDGKKYTSAGFWNTGCQPIYNIELESGRLVRVTANHQIMTSHNKWVEAQHLNVGEKLRIHNHRGNNPVRDWMYDTPGYARGYLLGAFIGDGNLRDGSAEVQENECLSDKKYLSKKASSGTWDYLLGLLAGYFDADGHVIYNEDKGHCVRLTSSQLDNLRNIQNVLSAFGVNSKIYQDRCPEGLRVLPDGNGGYAEYWCEATHDLHISKDNLIVFHSVVKFKNKEKQTLLDKIVNSYKRGPHKTKFEDKIVNISIGQAELVYDCSVPEIEAFDANGVYVHNCVEISFWCYDVIDPKKFQKWLDKNGNSAIIDCDPAEIGLESGWQACNLSTINCGKIKDEEGFYNACRLAAIIGTLQAGFTDFSYLEQASRNIVEREALLGVSMTGIMESSDICLNPKIQRNGAKIIKKLNEEIATLIGINFAARTTCIKPEGTSSCVLGTSSGIHPHHAKRYIRRVQTNKDDKVYQFFKNVNPLACEESVWSANNTDDVISFCIEVPDGSKLKNQINALDLLETVKKTQNNWVEEGTRPELCSMPWLRHNVSNTITVKPGEWQDVADFIYKNRKYFCGISLLSFSGDKDYPQAPFTTVHLPHEIVSLYGDGSLFVSGLIETALELYEDNLWDACDALLVINDNIKGKAKKEWIERCNKFADKYFDSQLRHFTYCMKDVYNWKLWLDLQRAYVAVDYTDLVEDQDNTKRQETVACAGGACEI